MRTTLELDDDLILVGKRLAEQRRTTLGRVFSDLVRVALTPKEDTKVKNGVPLFKVKAGARKPSLDLVNRLRDAGVSATLLDVNVLIALFDPAHPSHGDAHAFFEAQRRKPWATTPLTIDGFVRVISNPAYPTVDATPAEAAAHLRKFCKSDQHTFWLDDVSLIDEGILRPQYLEGHRQITDTRLLALAVRNEGRLATFDRRLPVRAVKGAAERHIRLIG